MNGFEFNSIGTNVLLRGRLIAASDQNERTPLVIMLTGDGRKGSKSLSWVNIPPKLQEGGISSFLFDFEGLGDSQGERRTLSLSRGIENFKSAYEFVLQQDWCNKDRVGVFASSFGANVVLLTPEIANNLKALGLKSPASFIADAYYNEIGKDLFNRWREEGFLEDNGYEFSVFLDALKHNTFASASQIKTSCLITQGDVDEIIPVQHTIYLYEALGSSEKRLELFQGTGHGYSEGDAWDRMAQMFVNWFAEKL